MNTYCNKRNIPTWNVQIPYTISCSSCDAIPASSDALDVSDATAGSGSSATKRRHSRRKIVRFRSENQMRFGINLAKFTYGTRRHWF